MWWMFVLSMSFIVRNILLFCSIRLWIRMIFGCVILWVRCTLLWSVLSVVVVDVVLSLRSLSVMCS